MARDDQTDWCEYLAGFKTGTVTVEGPMTHSFPRSEAGDLECLVALLEEAGVSHANVSRPRDGTWEVLVTDGGETVCEGRSPRGLTEAVGKARDDLFARRRKSAEAQRAAAAHATFYRKLAEAVTL